MRTRCHAKDCPNLRDPCFYIHGPGLSFVPACDAHGNPGCTGDPCTCPPHDGRAKDPLPARMTEEEWARLKQVTWFRDEQDRVTVEMDRLRAENVVLRNDVRHLQDEFENVEEP